MQKVIRKTILLGNVELEVFQLPNQTYQLSQTQVAQAVGKPENSLRRFLTSKCPQSLPYKSFSPVASKVEGESHLVKLIPVEIAAAYWLKETLAGNPLAAATLAGCAMESIERRADQAFGKKTSEAEYNEKLAKIRDMGKRTRRRLTDSVKSYIQRTNYQGDQRELYRNLTAMLNRLLFGKNAAKIQEERGSFITRDNLDFEELRDVENLENAASTLIDQHNMQPTKAVRAAYQLINSLGGLRA